MPVLLFICVFCLFRFQFVFVYEFFFFPGLGQLNQIGLIFDDIESGWALYFEFEKRATCSKHAVLTIEKCKGVNRLFAPRMILFLFLQVWDISHFFPNCFFFVREIRPTISMHLVRFQLDFTSHLGPFKKSTIFELIGHFFTKFKKKSVLSLEINHFINRKQHQIENHRILLSKSEVLIWNIFKLFLCFKIFRFCKHNVAERLCSSTLRKSAYFVFDISELENYGSISSSGTWNGFL